MPDLYVCSQGRSIVQEAFVPVVSVCSIESRNSIEESGNGESFSLCDPMARVSMLSEDA